MLVLIVFGSRADAEVETSGRGIAVQQFIYDRLCNSTLCLLQVQFQPALFAILKRWYTDKFSKALPGELLYYGTDPR